MSVEVILLSKYLFGKKCSALEVSYQRMVVRKEQKHSCKKQRIRRHVKSLTIVLKTNKQKVQITVLVFNWNHFEMRLLNLRINFYLLRTFCSHLGSFCVVSSFTTFRPNFTSGLLQVILLRPRLGMLSLVTVPPVITAFHSCCLSHHVFDQVNLWPAWVGFETSIFWQCSPGTVETQHSIRYAMGAADRCVESQITEFK